MNKTVFTRLSNNNSGKIWTNVKPSVLAQKHVYICKVKITQQLNNVTSGIFHSNAELFLSKCNVILSIHCNVFSC